MAAGLVWPLVVEDRASTVLTRFGGIADSTATAADRLTESIAATNDAMTSMSRTERATKAAQLDFVAATAKAAKAATDESISIERLASAQAGALRAQSRLAAVTDPYAKMRASAEKMSTVGATLTKTLTLPVAAFAAYGVDEAVKFQRSMTTIQVTSGETAAKMQQLKSGVVDMAKATGTSFSDLEQGLYTVAKAGAQKWSANQQLQVLRAGAQGARIESVDLGTSMSALTSVMQGYGLSTGKAVQAENEIIRASGLSKTSMSEFAGSLANVVPLASALHISFAQVGAAIATMTQHGETADRATDNLNNLIRNLAGSNNAAVQAMGQLKIKSQDVAETLSRTGPGGGLSGALNMVEQAMEKNSKGGMVVVSAFKNAQNATHDLNVELSHMPVSLQGISKQFESGKLGYQDYYSDVKGLGGAAFEMGKQFISTMSTAKGFSAALKSGNPQVQTTAQAFKTLLGGATGMNAALMLSGNSAKTFASNAAQIGDAANSAGKNVEGWGKIQRTTAQQFAEDMQKFNAAAMGLGTQLLPELTKLANTATGVVDAFSHMSGTQRNVAEWGVGILAALGPVLTLGGRLATVGMGISKFTVGATSSFATMAGATEEQAAVISSAAGRISTAIGAAGIGVAVGELTRNSDTATRSIGVLGSALAGAAIGSAGGPWGIAIGAAAGAVGDLATQWFNSGSAAKTSSAKAQEAAAAAARAAQAEKQAVQGLLASLQQVGGQYGKNYRLAVVNSLQQDGTLNKGQAVGINPQQIVNAALGKQQALASIMTELYKSSPDLGLLTPKMQAFVKSLDNATGETGKAEKAYELYEQAQGKGVVKASQLAGGLANLTKELGKHGTALTDDNNKTVASSGFAARNTAVLKANVAQINKTAVAQLAHGTSVATVATNYEKQIADMQSSTKTLGFNQDAVSKLIATEGKLPAKVVTYLEKQGVTPQTIQAILDKYNQTPKSKTTQMTVQGGDALSVLNAIHNSVDSLPASRTITVTTITNSKTGAGTTSTVHAYATGGPAKGAGTSTSDSIFAKLSNNEHVWTAAEVMAAGGHAAVERMRAAALHHRLPQFASGGPVYKVGKGWGYDGEYYAKRKDAASARREAIDNARAAALNPAANIPPPKHLAHGIDHIHSGGYSYQGQYYASYTDAAAARVDARHSAAAGLPDATSTYRSAVKSGDVAQTKAAYATLIADARAAGDSKKALDKLSASEKKIIADMKARAKITAEAAKAQTYLSSLESKAAQLRSSVSSAITGSFDITTAGTSSQMFNDQAAAPVSASSILSQLTAAANKAVAFGALLKKLGKEGLNKALISQLAQAGPAAFDQAKALAAATPKQLAAINSEESKLTAAGKAAGAYTSTLIFGSKIDAAKALLDGYSPKNNAHMGAAVKQLATQLFGAGQVTGKGLAQGLLGEKDTAGNAAAKLGREVEKQLKKQLGIASPSKVTRDLGRHTGLGFALGLTDSVAGVVAASAALGGAAMPTGSSGGNGYTHNEVHHHHEWNITEAQDGMEVHHKVMRRLALTRP